MLNLLGMESKIPYIESHFKRGSIRNGRKMARAKMGAGPPTPLGGTIGVL